MKKLGLIMMMLFMSVLAIGQTTATVQIDKYSVGVMENNKMVFSNTEFTNSFITIDSENDCLYIQQDDKQITYNIVEVKRENDCYMSIIVHENDEPLLFLNCRGDKFMYVITPNIIIRFHLK